MAICHRSGVLLTYDLNGLWQSGLWPCSHSAGCDSLFTTYVLPPVLSGSRYFLLMDLLWHLLRFIYLSSCQWMGICVVEGGGLCVELGRFSKNGRSPIFRFYVSLFPISDSDPDFYSRWDSAWLLQPTTGTWQRLLPTIQSALPLDW